MIKLNLLKAIFTGCLTLLWICQSSLSHAQTFVDQTKVSENLFNRISNAESDYISFSILLTDRVNIRELDNNFYKQNYSLEQRVATLIPLLKNKAQTTQDPVIQFLNQTPDVDKNTIRSFWINNSIFVSAKPNVIVQLSKRADILWMELNLGGEISHSTMSVSSAKEIGGIEPGLAAVNAPAMWQLGYTGYGRKSFVIDTGTDPDHPALSRQYWGNYVPESQAWFDYNNGTPSSYDCFFHGTHVTGTVIGVEDATEDTIGVAIEGLWMASPAICDTTMADDVASLQWALDPDNNSNTISDMPDVINNSWYNVNLSDTCGFNPYIDAMNALEAAGIAVIFAAGNFGPGNSTVTPPQTYVSDLVNSFTVGAVDGNDSSLQIAGFSSRGPSTCGDTGSLAIRPEVSAPGFFVRSSTPGGNYGLSNGTSMAAPHVSGAILILKQAFPYLTGTQLKMALYLSAADLGVPGEDNTYGNGIIDVFAAYNHLLNQGNTPAPTTSDYDLTVTGIEAGKTILCAGESISPIIDLKNNGELTVDSFEVIMAYSNGQMDTLQWSGSLAPDSTTTISLPSTIFPEGEYSLRINTLNPNGQEDLRFLDNIINYAFIVVDDPRLAGGDKTACENANALLTVPANNPWNVVWYDTINGGIPVFSGENFFTPEIPLTTTWYVANGYLEKVGLPENDFSSGNFDTALEGYLTFDAHESFTLGSVKVYAQNLAARLFQIRDSADSILQGTIVLINPGESIVDLQFQIEPGIGQKLYVSNLNGLFQQTSGVNYPLSYPGWLDITGSSDGDSVYKYFYDWIIFKEGECPRTPITVETLPGVMNAAFIATPDSVTLPNQSGEIQFQDLSANATNWEWDFGDSTFSTDQNPVHTYSLIGKYGVTLTATGQDGCKDTYIDSVTINGWNTGIKGNLLDQKSFSIYPNPTNGIFFLSFKEQSREEVKVRVFDISGKEVLQTRGAFIDTNTQKLDLSQVSNGVYFLLVELENKYWSQKIIKQKN